MSCVEDPARNLSRALDAVGEAARGGAGLVCLPELFRTRYFCQAEDPGLFDLAEEIPGPTTRALAEAAGRLRVVIVGSIFERRAPGLHHNTAVVLDADGALRGIYRKMHIPHDPLFFEKYYFTPGDTGFPSFRTRHAVVGPLVCWDQWYPEAARLSALGGAEILLYPTAIGWHHKEKAEFGEAQQDAWMTVQRAHAISNGVFVAAVNRVGTEGGLEFWGSSFVADPFGRLLARAPCDGEAVLFAECDLDAIEDVRRNWPFLRDRRVDAYGGLSARYLDPRP
jgi:N-carbamoylputrescine amidase